VRKRRPKSYPLMQQPRETLHNHLAWKCWSPLLF
jgi:hypothetical protein